MFEGLFFIRQRMNQLVKAGQWVIVVLCALLLSEAKAAVFVNITFVSDAVKKGAVCLDGSPPAYHLDRGLGKAVNNWLVHLEGGGWCHNVSHCLQRQNTRLGSSSKMAKQIPFSGILSSQRRQNPDFYNWNRVKVRYCDGSSFTGNLEEVDPSITPARTSLHFRGAKVFVAVLEDLLAKGMKNAKQGIISGCSAGGLASILHCDSFRSILPQTAKVKCISDAGFFIDGKDVSGGRAMQTYFSQVVAIHNSAMNLPSSCTSNMSPSLCFFPQNVAKYIQTPLFILNSAYDSWQIRNILAPSEADPRHRWKSCKYNFNKCSTAQLQEIKYFREEFLNALTKLGPSKSRGAFVDSCYLHCQTEMQALWHTAGSPTLHNMSISKAVGDWFFDRSPVWKIDCPYPCNPTCHNMFLNPRSKLAVQLQPDALLNPEFFSNLNEVSQSL